MKKGSNTYYYHNDHLATPQKMTDSSGTVVWSADYKPFGEATVTVSTITNNLRFPGQYFDSETGLHYNYFRDYNPAIGKYIEADPIGLRKTNNNLYSYVNNKPITSIDKKGLMGSLPKEPDTKEIQAALGKMKGDILSQILEMGISDSIAGITGAVCASKYCKANYYTNDYMKAYGNCAGIFDSANLPTWLAGISQTTDDFLDGCANECKRLMNRPTYKKACGVCE